jgi:hypothetical protein
LVYFIWKQWNGGIPGYRKTAKDAVEDFENSRKQLNGEVWTKKNIRGH